MQFNSFDLYSLTSGIKTVPTKDEIDTCIENLVKIDEYNDVKMFLEERFGKVEPEKWFKYENLNKSVYIKETDEVIEFCALKGDRQYFGKGWKLISK